VLVVEINAKPTNFLSMVLVSAIRGIDTDTGTSITGAFMRMTLLGASGGSAAGEIVTSVIRAVAVNMIDFRSVRVNPCGAESFLGVR